LTNKDSSEEGALLTFFASGFVGLDRTILLELAAATGAKGMIKMAKEIRTAMKTLKLLNEDVGEKLFMNRSFTNEWPSTLDNALMLLWLDWLQDAVVNAAF
jgi:hypothetical protein